MRFAMIATLCAAWAITAADPKAGDGALYFPVKEGTKRVSEVKVGERTIEMTETVTKVESKDGKHVVTTEVVHKSEKYQTTINIFEVSERGLSRISGRQKEREPLPLLKLGTKEGESWTADQMGQGGVVGKATYTMGKMEEVKVPAGTFTARRVDVEITFGASTHKMSNWYAPGIGSVKFEADLGGKGMQTTVLKSFTSGK
ncbi:hypothetical protein R5W23_005393 [Gemmata sp. JC673]|uniref:DUF3108 domain-containing protein n=1 Tax=Gemmata algarum TaxID=2975278 RepID=A0ABU5ET79_9BACT|nr:hypothetical protein [Gemmata algarum]MDY3558365.1 hypothetical protein [Gemmata algarum]